MDSRTAVSTTASTFVADTNRLLRDDLVRAHALHGVVAARDLGDDGVVIVGVEPSAIADLAAGLGIEGRVIENDLAFFAGLEFLRALPALDDGKHLATVGAGLPVAFEDRFRELLVGGIGGLLGRAFPGGAGTLALLLHRAIEALLDRRLHPDRGRILHEVERHAEGVVKPEASSP